MALPTALPAPPLGLGGNNEASNEYMGALQKVLASLEDRNKTNWFSVAGSLLDPGKTGNVGEAIGKAGTELGRQQEKDQEQAPTIAMMRAQIAGQKYTLDNDAKALKLMADNGLSPTDLQNPENLDQSQLTQIQKLYPLVAQLSPQRAETLSKMFTMGVESKKLEYQGIDERTKAADIVIKNGAGAIPYLTESIIKGMPGAPAQTAKNVGFGFSLPVPDGKISSPFGQRVDPLNKDKTEMHGGIDIAAPEGAPVQSVLPGIVRRVLTPEQSGGYGNKVEVVHKDGSISYYAHLKDVNVKPDQQIGRGDDIGTVGKTGRATGPHLEFGLRDRGGAPLDPTPLFSSAAPPKAQGVQVATAGDNSLEALPLAARNEIQSGRVKEADKDFLAKRSEVFNYTPAVTKALNEDLREVHDIAAKYPRVFGVMKESGFLSGLANAAQTGVQANVLGYSANLGLPVKQFIESAKFNQEERNAFDRANQVVANIFLGNVKSNKGLLGVNPTDNDARLLQAPMSTTADTAKAVQFWARQEMLKNIQRQEMYQGLVKHDSTHGKTADPSLFFANPDQSKDTYNQILDTYAKRRRALQSQVGPTAQ